MQNAKEAVAGFLSKNNHHSVDIEQTSSPAIAHERFQEARHENLTVAHDREIHQHHHQTHVQPIQDKVVEPEQHHHNIIPVEHRHHHHGKDAEVERTLTEQAAQFRDEQEVLPTQHSKSNNTVVGEHVHHHIHDTIQPVIERERLQQHVVHTTIPIHERIDKEPVIHSGNVLPTKTLAEFEAAGHSLTGHTTKPEHIDYEGEPLKIREDSRVGFDHHSRHQGDGTVGAPGELGTNTGHVGAAGITGGSGLTGTGGSGMTVTGTGGSGLTGTGGSGMTGTGTGASGDYDAQGHTNALTGKSTAGPHDSNIENKIDPRVDSDRDGKSGLGRDGNAANTVGNLGENNTSGTYGNTSSTNGYNNNTTTGTGGYNNNTTTGTGTTDGYNDTTTGNNTLGEKQSTGSKVMNKLGL